VSFVLTKKRDIAIEVAKTRVVAKMIDIVAGDKKVTNQDIIATTGVLIVVANLDRIPTLTTLKI
jgi:hypothetical protein